MNKDILASHAWRRMSEERSCPPLNVLRRGGQLVDQHLKSCSSCRSTLEISDLLEETGEKLAIAPMSKKIKTPISPGDIRRIQPVRPPNAWFDAGGTYHNPPLILVLQKPDNDGFTRVAQIFDEPDLCDQGDVPLGRGLYAEGWNIYGIHCSYLANAAYGHVQKFIVDEVAAMALLEYQNLDTRSPLYHFRTLEIDTGSFFCLEANAAKLDNADNMEASSDEIFWAWNNKWEDYVKSIPMAAASPLGIPDDMADEVIQGSCLISENNSQPRAIAAQIRLHYFDGGFICTAFCPFDGYEKNIQVFMALSGEKAEQITTAKVGNVLRIRGIFNNQANPEEIRIMILSHGE